MNNDLTSYLLPLERQLRLAALGCGYRIVDWMEKRSVPLAEGKTDSLRHGSRILMMVTHACSR
ncbi:hypothetical protein EGJ52_24235 [Pseudomonas luteola]|nr:hypothetical protein EGJ52_24235 [Pseudomonas luteola]